MCEIFHDMWVDLIHSNVVEPWNLLSWSSDDVITWEHSFALTKLHMGSFQPSTSEGIVWFFINCNSIFLIMYPSITDDIVMNERRYMDVLMKKTVLFYVCIFVLYFQIKTRTYFNDRCPQTLFLDNVTLLYQLIITHIYF